MIDCFSRSQPEVFEVDEFVIFVGKVEVEVGKERNGHCCFHLVTNPPSVRFKSHKRGLLSDRKLVPLKFSSPQRTTVPARTWAELKSSTPQQQVDSSKSQLSLLQRLKGWDFRSYVDELCLVVSQSQLHRRIPEASPADRDWSSTTDSLRAKRRDDKPSEDLWLFGLVGTSKAKLSCWFKKASNFDLLWSISLAPSNKTRVLVKKQDDVVDNFWGSANCLIQKWCLCWIHNNKEFKKSIS